MNTFLVLHWDKSCLSAGALLLYQSWHAQTFPSDAMKGKVMFLMVLQYTVHVCENLVKVLLVYL